MNISNKYDAAFRMLERIGEIETLSKSDIMTIHDTLIERIGGSYGIRDNNLLESVVAAPYQCVFEEELYPSLFDKAGKYMFDFCNYQIFVDGNKRTGVASAETFLNQNGYEMTFTNEEIYNLAIDIATGKITNPCEVGNKISQHVKFFKEPNYEQNNELEEQSEPDDDYEEER